MAEYTLSEVIKLHQCLSKFRKPLIEQMIADNPIVMQGSGLDAGCGIGHFTNLLLEASDHAAQMTGLDISNDFIEYAKCQYPDIYFSTGDVTQLPFKDRKFDWIWSIDTVWPGPKELGCPSDTPFSVLNEYKRVVKPGGRMILAYWSSQKFLPGYPFLEARLNNTESANAPFVSTTKPEMHLLNARKWFEDLELIDVQSKTYVHHLEGPFSDDEKLAMSAFIHMLWSDSKKELDDRDEKLFLSLTNPDSEKYILNLGGYCGFYTYTVFSGQVPSE